MDAKTRWQYHVVRAELDRESYARVVWIDDNEDAEYASNEPMRLKTLYEVLDDWGDEGWELVGFSPIQGSNLMQYILKRPSGWRAPDDGRLG
ncbi:MAG: hypothetical protein ACR2JC_16710 [Chloroflexota bacterium]